MIDDSKNRWGSAGQLAPRWLAVGLILAFAAARPALAQDQNPPDETTTTLRVSTNVVNVLAIVKDKQGHLIPSLTKDDFTLSEDGKAQEIRYFSRETDTPLTLGILVDTSGSEQRMLSVEQQRAKDFIRQVVRPKDLAFVMHFDLEAELLQDLTSDVSRLDRAIGETQINAGGTGVLPSTFPGQDNIGTVFYDAVYLAAHDILRNEIGRKVIVVITDGMDHGSKESLDSALEMAQKADVTIYCIAVIGQEYGGEGIMEKLSRETGGRVIRANRDKDLAVAFQQIADELRTQYLLGYTPIDTRHDGAYRKISVKVRDGQYKVQARRGYYAPSS